MYLWRGIGQTSCSFEHVSFSKIQLPIVFAEYTDTAAHKLYKLPPRLLLLLLLLMMMMIDNDNDDDDV